MCAVRVQLVGADPVLAARRGVPITGDAIGVAMDDRMAMDQPPVVTHGGLRFLRLAESFGNDSDMGIAGGKPIAPRN